MLRNIDDKVSKNCHTFAYTVNNYLEQISALIELILDDDGLVSVECTTDGVNVRVQVCWRVRRGPDHVVSGLSDAVTYLPTE